MGKLSYFLKKFSSLDVYGHEVKLLYKGKEKKNSFIGAVFTLLTVALITLYLGYQLKEIDDNKSEVKALILDVNTNEVYKRVK